MFGSVGYACRMNMFDRLGVSKSDVNNFGCLFGCVAHVAVFFTFDCKTKRKDHKCVYVWYCARKQTHIYTHTFRFVQMGAYMRCTNKSNNANY